MNIQPIDLSPKTQLGKSWQSFLDRAGEIQHDFHMQSAAKAVRRISHSSEDMMRLAATFPGELVHSSSHQVVVESVRRLTTEVERLTEKETQLKKKSAKLRERNRDVKALKQKNADQKELIQFLLEKLGMTQEEFLHEMLEVKAAAISESNEVEAMLKDKALKVELLQTVLQGLEK